MSSKQKTPRQQLIEEARGMGISGAWKMRKDELEEAISRQSTMSPSSMNSISSQRRQRASQQPRNSLGQFVANSGKSPRRNSSQKTSSRGGNGSSRGGNGSSKQGMGMSNRARVNENSVKRSGSSDCSDSDSYEQKYDRNGKVFSSHVPSNRYYENESDYSSGSDY